MATRSGNRQQANSGGANTAAKPAMRKPVFIKVDQLKPGTTGHNLTVKIVNANTVLSKKPRNPSSLRVPARPQQNTRIAECLVGDETGSILLTARNEQGLFLTLLWIYVYHFFFAILSPKSGPFFDISVICLILCGL